MPPRHGPGRRVPGFEGRRRDIRLSEAPPRRTEAGSNVGGYNNFWLDFGTNVIDDRRTSPIVTPPNGRILALSEEGQRRADERRAYRKMHPADSYTDRSTFDRSQTRSTVVDTRGRRSPEALHDSLLCPPPSPRPRPLRVADLS